MPENPQLSERELEILRLVATGASNKDIAGELVISVNTVKVHLRNIFSKLEVSSRTEATFFAVQTGLVPSPVQSEENSGEADQIEIELRQAVTEHAGKRRMLAGTLIIFAVIAGISAVLLGINWLRQPYQNPEAALTAQELEQDRWEDRVKMEDPRSNFATAVIDGDIFVIGGETEQGVTEQVERYRVDTDTWEHGSDMPQPGADMQAVTIGGKILVPGGRLENGALSRQLLIYEPDEGIWQQAAQMPVGLSAYALVAFEGKLFLFGGWDGKDYVNTGWQYDPSLDRWESLTPMPTARGFASAGVSGGEIHLVGGYDGEKALDIHEVYTPVQEKEGGDPWTVLAPLPEARCRARIVSVAEIIHFIGGTDNMGKNLYSFKYFSQNDEWEQFLIPMQDSWTDMGAEIVGEHIYIFGGQVGNRRTDRNFSYRAVYSILMPILP